MCQLTPRASAGPGRDCLKVPWMEVRETRLVLQQPVLHQDAWEQLPASPRWASLLILPSPLHRGRAMSPAGLLLIHPLKKKMCTW